MKRVIIAYGQYYREFLSTLTEKEKALKIKEEYYEYKKELTDEY